MGQTQIYQTRNDMLKRFRAAKAQEDSSPLFRKRREPRRPPSPEAQERIQSQKALPAAPAPSTKKTRFKDYSLLSGVTLSSFRQRTTQEDKLRRIERIFKGE